MADGDAGAVLTGHDGGVRSVAFSPGGRRDRHGGTQGAEGLGGGHRPSASIAFGHVDANNPQQVAPVHAVAFVGGRAARLGLGGPHGPEALGLRGPMVAAPTLEPHDFRVLAIDFSPDGKLIATGGGDAEPHPARSSSGTPESGSAAQGAARTALRHRLRPPVQPRRVEAGDGAADKFVKVVAVPQRRGAEDVRGAHPPRDGRRLEGRRQAARQRRGRSRVEVLGRRDGRAGPDLAGGRRAR